MMEEKQNGGPNSYRSNRELADFSREGNSKEGECRCHHDRTSELSVQRVVSFEPFKLSSVPLGR